MFRYIKNNNLYLIYMEGLIETKNEYIEHMQDIITIPISKKIYEIWCECSKRKGSIKEFQKELVQIKKWNNNLINEEYKKIVKTTKCKYLADLIKIIIITTIKIKIYEYKDYFDNIKIKIPSPEDFIHKCYINVSIFSWKNAYLFNNKNMKDSEYQNNLNIIEENFKIIIKKTFRDFIPFDDIFQQIKDNLTDNVKQTNSDDDKKSSNKKKDVTHKTSLFGIWGFISLQMDICRNFLELSLFLLPHFLMDHLQYAQVI